MTEIDVVLSFDQPATLETVGGKGLNLMRLAKAGMPVPPGFVISTAAYDAFVQANHLDQILPGLLDALQQGEPLAEISARVRAAFASGEFPTRLARRIVEAYRELSRQAGQPDVPVAVRSSATAEDLAEASFAGQQDTYLNIHGEEAVLDAVRRCFGSLWSERAIDYRAQQGLAPLGVRLAIVVQQMVFAEAAGVVFTANPISGDPHQVVIDATWGLGEALVSGLVTPDHIVVDKRTGAVLSQVIAEKTTMVISTPDGTQERPVPRGKARRKVLGDATIRALTTLAQAVEEAHGRPQDMEWCLAGGKLYIVQARPITTLPERPVIWDAPGPGQWLHGGGTFEMITEPISPLFETFLLPILVATIVKMVEHIGLKSILPAVPYRVVNGFIYLHLDLHPRPWHLGGIVRDFAYHLDSMQDQQAEQRLYRETVAALAAPPLAECSAAQVLDRMAVLGRTGMRYWLQIMRIVQVVYRRERAFVDFYDRHARRADDPEPEVFLRGQKIMPWEAECSTFELAQLARKHRRVADILSADPGTAQAALTAFAEGREFLAALREHLERYGHQLSSFDLSLPTLADDPRPILTAIQAFLSGKESPVLRQERMAMEREQAIAWVVSRLAARSQREFSRLLAGAQEVARLREDALFDVGLAWTPMHRCALELGCRLSQAGLIAQPEDIFWLTLSEVRSAFDEEGITGMLLTQRVDERQANHKVWSQVEAPYLLPVGSQPAFWWSWVFPTPELQRHPNAHTLIGLGVSPGKVTAVARVIQSLDDMQQLNTGEILVARTTTPAWTPLFARAGGLVTDLGGPLAHGSIVAREYGIPAVMGTGSATRHIHSGQVITVYGSDGKVVLQ